MSIDQGKPLDYNKFQGKYMHVLIVALLAISFSLHCRHCSLVGVHQILLIVDRVDIAPLVHHRVRAMLPHGQLRPDSLLGRIA